MSRLGSPLQYCAAGGSGCGYIIVSSAIALVQVGAAHVVD